MKRSLFGLVHCYNKLPQRLVDMTSIKALQRNFQLGLLKYADRGAPDWQALYSSGWRKLARSKLDELFP